MPQRSRSVSGRDRRATTASSVAAFGALLLDPWVRLRTQRPGEITGSPQDPEGGALYGGQALLVRHSPSRPLAIPSHCRGRAPTTRNATCCRSASHVYGSRSASRFTSRWASVAAFSSLSGASSTVISVSSASGDARRIPSTLRWVAACAGACVCWMRNTIVRVVAAAIVGKAVTSRAGNPNWALDRTHTTSAVTTLSASVVWPPTGPEHVGRDCWVPLPGLLVGYFLHWLPPCRWRSSDHTEPGRGCVRHHRYEALRTRGRSRCPIHSAGCLRRIIENCWNRPGTLV